MPQGRRNYSMDYQPQSRAIQSLLDCSNTLKNKHNYKTLRIEDEDICPWPNLNAKPLRENKNNCLFVKTNRTFTKTYNRFKGNKSREKDVKTVLATPKRKVILDEIQNYNYMSSNVINLTRQLQLIHHKKKNNYASNYIRQQLYLRLKTT